MATHTTPQLPNTPAADFSDLYRRGDQNQEEKMILGLPSLGSILQDYHLNRARRSFYDWPYLEIFLSQEFQ